MENLVAKKLAQVVTLLNCIRGIPGSNLVWGTDYSEVFRAFRPFPQAKCRAATLI
jgi:hypothetical protein